MDVGVPRLLEGGGARQLLRVSACISRLVGTKGAVNAANGFSRRWGIGQRASRQLGLETNGWAYHGFAPTPSFFSTSCMISLSRRSDAATLPCASIRKMAGMPVTPKAWAAATAPP